MAAPGFVSVLPAMTFLLLLFITHTHASFPSSVTGFYTDASSEQTVLLDKKISPRLKKNIRNEILHLLGLQHRPRVPVRMDTNSAPQYMLQLYKTLEDGQKAYEEVHDGDVNVTMPVTNSLGGADLIMSFVNQAGLKQLYSDGGRRFYFYFGQVPQTEHVTGAEFRVYKYPSPWLQDREPFSVQLFKLRDDRGRSETVLELETVLRLSAREEGWLQMNVTRAIEHWRQDPTEEVILYMEVTDAAGRDVEPSTIGLVDNAGPEDKQAFLVTCFKANHKLHVRKSRNIDTPRNKRSPSPSSYYSDEKDYGWRYPVDRSSRKACQRRQLYVSFRALQWESWVIAPEGYPAFYCDGECMFPLNVHMNATNHAIVQALVHLVKPFLAPNPCCAPTTLHAISFLYLDNSYNVVLKNYKNMVVQACGCH